MFDIETNDVDVNVTSDDDLENFSNEFFGKPTKVEDSDAPDSTEDDDSLATDPVEPKDDDTPPDDDQEDDEVEEDEKPAFIPKKKQTAQERINQAVARQRELERELEALRAKSQEPPVPPAKETKAVETDSARPDPDARDENGDLLYPLGDYDPAYIEALTDYTFTQREKAFEAKLAQREQERQLEAVRNELTTEWQGKLAKAEETYEDFRESSSKLETYFESIDPAYGEYLATTIMSMENGADVLYYLSQNPEEAQSLVTAAPTQATIALGELNGMFKRKEKGNKKLNVSQAPEPPPTNKGRAVSRDIPDDTDDLDAFEKKFFVKKR